MEVYRFKMMNSWYGYALQKDAEDAREWFLRYGYPPSVVGPIEKSDERDFQLKMNSVVNNSVYGVRR